MKRIIHILIIICSIPLFGEQLFYEDFGSGTWPTNWEHDGNWEISNVQNSSHEGNNTPPAAWFSWSPQVTFYEDTMTSPIIDIQGNNAVLVNFYFALDFYSQGELNGLRISYNGGAGWTDVLSYRIGPGLEIQDNPWTSNESFMAEITSGSDLQIRWTAYGDNSWAIDGWAVDNIQVITLPKLTDVRIEAISDDPTTATVGNYIDLIFTGDSDFEGNPFVQVNGNSTDIFDLGNRTWQARYTVLESDPDGPLEFTIDFTDNNGTDGSTVRSTTDGSYVIVDNSPPPRFNVGAVTSLGGNSVADIWNSTNTDIQLEVNVPQDSAVTSFNYYQSNSLSFNGVSDKMTIPGNAAYQITNTLTVETWVKPNTVPTDYDGFLNYAYDAAGIQAGFGFSFYLTGWRFFLKTETNSINYSGMAEAQMPIGQWTHMAATYDGTHIKLYKNGTLVDSTDASGNIQWSGVPAEMTLGKFDRNGSSFYFDGQIDDFRIWNVVRTKEQIKASKEIYVNVEEPGLVGYWQMDEGFGSSAADSTVTANHGTINGASWIIADSPIDLKTPIYDTGVIIGSSFKLRGRVSSNEFEGIGSNDTITVSDFNLGTKIISATENDFRAITGFVQGETAQLSAFLYDVTGNFSLGDTSITNTVIDMIANSPTPVSIYSNNTFSHLAKTGDVVTVTMSYNEDVETPSITFDGNNADDVTDLGSEQFSSTYTLVGTEAEGSLPFTISTTDYLGNPGAVTGSTDGTTVVFDNTTPVVSPMTLVSTNADPQWAMIGDTVKLNLNGNEILYETVVTLAGSSVILYDTSDVAYIGLSECAGGEVITNNLKLWLDANDVDGDGASEGLNESTLIGNEVSIWTDKSGNGSDVLEVAGQGIPTLVQNHFNGQSTLQFNKSEEDVLVHDLGMDNWTATEFTLFIVFQQIGTPLGYDSFFSNGDNNNNDYFQITHLTNNGNFKFLSGGDVDFEPWDNDLKLYGVIANSEGTSTIVDGKVANTASNLNGRIFDKYKINRNRLNSQYNDSYISEVLLYDRELNETELNKTYKYLGNKFGLTFTDDSTIVYAQKEMNGTDPEGKISININYNDCAGNDAIALTETTDGSYVIFDMSPPTDFTVGSVLSTGGNSVIDAWNSTNTGLDVTVPVDADTTLKNGSIQVWAKAGTNAFELLGDASTITDSEVGTDKVISFTPDQIEAVTGFAEEDTLTIKAVMKDRPGNQTTGSQSVNRLVIDQVLPSVLSSHIESNNADTTKAKVGDSITLTFQTDEIIQTPTSTLSTQTATVSDLGSNNWSSIYIMQETDTEGVIPFTLDGLVDARGNPADGFTTTSDGSNVVYDRTKPILNPVQLSSNNDWNQYWAKEGDYGSIYSNSNEDLLTLVCKFNGNTTTDNWYNADEFELGYTFSSTDIEGLVSYEIIYSDSAGNFGDTVLTSTNNTFLIFDKTPPTDFTVGDAASTGGNIVTSYWNSTNTGIDIIIPIESDSTLDSGRVQIWAKVGTNAFEMLGDSSFILSSEVGATKTMSIPGESVRAITGYTENDTISLKAFIFDIPGNETVGTESLSKLLIDETPPSLISASYESNFSDSSLATVGHVVTLTFETDVEIQTPSATISTQNAIISDLGSNQWSASYEMQDDDTEGVIPFQIGTLTDSRGNPTEGTSSTTNGTIVTFDNTKPTLTTVSIASDNADTTWAKVGDTLTVKFIGDELLSEQSVTIATQSATITDFGSENYTAKYTMTETDQEGVVAFEITVTDSVDLVSDPVSETTDESLVIFDRTLPTLSPVHIESDNANNTLIAIGGDNVYLTFTPPIEPLLLDSIVVTIAGLATTLTESDGSYTATLTLTGSEPDGILEFTIDFKDRAGNPGIQVTATTDESYVNHDIYPPEIEIASITSNNSDSTWAKVGDSVFVTFTASEILVDISITIAGVSSSYKELSGAKYQGYHIMDDSNDEGDIPFLITYTDLGGAIGPDADTTTNNTNVQFDKTVPEFSLVRMATNNIYGDSLAGIGSMDTLSFTISEVQNDLSVELAGSAKTASQNGLNFSTTHTFIASDIEGWVDFSISMTDSAGNPSDTLMISQDGSQVRFDGTLPILDDVNFFSNNSNDSSLCIPGDSLFLQYTSRETLRTTTITLAGNSPDESGWLDGLNYYASYILTGTEDEGFIPFTIGFEDWVGNPGDTISSTTNGSSVLFDMTPPDDFTLGDVVSKNGIEVAGYWNASNQTLEIVIPVPNDETLPGGGIQFQASFGGSYSNLADTINIDQSDLGMGKIVSISATDFESIAEFTENGNATFQAVLWDKAGNSTIGTASTSTIHIDQTLPILSMVSQRTNNAIADSLAKVGDTDTLIVSSTEGLDTLQVQIFSQDAVHSGANRDWTFTYSFQETDNNDMVSFNIVFGDTAGNLGTDVSTTTDGSTVRFDGTKPMLSPVSFSSTNSIDGGLAILADTLYLDFNSQEDLLTNEVLIAGFNADTTFENESRTPFRSWRIMDGTEPEGYITFRIVYSDLVGNVGDTITETSTETSVLFDMTPPADFELDSVLVSGGTVVFGYWNYNNDSLILKVPVPPTDETMIGGVFQPQVQFGDNAYLDLGTPILIPDELDTTFQNLSISRSVFTSVDGYGEDENALFIAIARDKAGNETIGTTDNTQIHIDETSPEITGVNFYSNNELDTNWAKLSDEILIQFYGSEGLSSPTINTNLMEMTLTSENAGTDWVATRLMTIEDGEGEISFSISYSDTAGNPGVIIENTTNGSGVKYDINNPTISNLLEGNENEDIGYYNQSDSITLYWEHSDSLAGIRDAFVALGTDSNLTDILDWRLSNNSPFSGMGGLSLVNDGIYFGGAFVRDSAGNHSDTTWGNSIYIDTEVPDTGKIIDGYWVMDLDYSIDSTKLSYIWSDFTDNTEIDYFEIAIGTGNDTINTMDWMRSDSTDSMTVTGLNLVRDTLYFSYIKAIDLATNQSISAKTDGIYFDDSFPFVNKITPNVISDSAGFLSVLSNDTITIKFNRPIYTYDLQAQSNVESDFTVSHEYGDSLITVIWENTLSSYDTITVVVDSAMAFNTLVISDTLKFYSQLWGDLNNDYDITVEDILMFNQNWPATDLGPYTDDPPHVRPNPDGEANLTDLAAFGKMWHWKYFNLDFDTTLFASRSSEGLEIIAQGSKAKISLPKNVAMAEMLIGESNLDVGKMNFMNPSGSAFIFTALDTSQGMKQFSMADYRGFDSTLTLWLPETEQTIFQVQLQYKFLDKDGVELAKGLQSVDIEILPENFTVYDNYPNPFNPVTTIRYELPDIRDVNIVIYDILGREIRKIDLNKVSAGRHQFKWSGTNDFGKRVSSGVYFLQLTAGRNTNIQKMLLLK